MLTKLACGLLIGLAAMAASAQTDIKANPESGGYAQDARGIIVRGGYGLCWRSGTWTPADSVPGCDGALVPPIAKPTAPDIVPPGTAPAAIATPPAPPAVAAPIPAPVARCDFSVTLESDQAFGFNQASLNVAAKKRLDEDVLPRLAACAKLEAVTVTGHTDRIGSRQYNEALSRRRAESVAGYLKRKHDAMPIKANGAGASEPISSCGSKLPRAKLIDCLSPDRRVTIEARGTSD